MRKTLWLTAVAALALVAQSGPDSAAAQTRTTLDIYVVDVEGGNATLLVAPSGAAPLGQAIGEADVVLDYEDDRIT